MGLTETNGRCLVLGGSFHCIERNSQENGSTKQEIREDHELSTQDHDRITRQRRCYTLIKEVLCCQTSGCFKCYSRNCKEQQMLRKWTDRMTTLHFLIT